jgi:hypothetical protein
MKRLAGQFFLLWGTYFAFTALTNKKNWRVAAAGACWTLTIGSRNSLVIAVAVLALLVVLWVILNSRRRLRSFLAFSAPLAVGAVLLGIYNQARFDVWHDFGMRYQLSAVPIREMGPHLFSSENVPPNLYSYTLRRWRWVNDFPSIRALKSYSDMPRWIRIPPFFHTEDISGIALTTPWLVLMLVPVWRVIRLRGGVRDPLNWVILSFLCASAGGFIPVLFLAGSTMRYFADATPSLFILFAIAMWMIEAKLSHNLRRAKDVRIAALLAVIYSSAIALILAVNGYQSHFATHNPELYEWMSRVLGGKPSL